MSGPVWHTPLTKISDHWMTHQWTECSGFEMDFFRCGARVGAKNAQTMCQKEKEDFAECALRTKQKRRSQHKCRSCGKIHKFQRYLLMQAERRKQKKPYIETPIRDSIGVQ